MGFCNNGDEPIPPVTENRVGWGTANISHLVGSRLIPVGGGTSCALLTWLFRSSPRPRLANTGTVR